ncbi:MAG: dihydroneopterin aldolase [Candidatus Aureabacteria bacterium]|nr:dihydroneopterin aldolase [Candidatus Auribacterota bacterium]
MAKEKNKLDKIHMRDLSLRCIIGVNDEERREKQDVSINVTLYIDLQKACLSDSLADSVDYKAIKKRIIEEVEGSSCQLLESLAEKTASLCLEEKRVRKVRVTVDKPGALRFCRSVAVEIIRKRS